MFGRFLGNQSGSMAFEYAAIASLVSRLIYSGSEAIGRALADRHLYALLKARTAAQS